MLDAATVDQPTGHALMQDPAFAAALRRCGQTPVVLSSGLLLLKRRLFGAPALMLPRAAPPPDFHTQLERVGLARVPLILSPEAPCALPFALRLLRPRYRLVVDLSDSAPARRSALHQNWRHQLGQAEHSGLTVRRSPMTPAHPLLALDATQARQRRYANWPTALTAAFATAAPRQTHVFAAHLNGRDVAHMLFLLHGTRATYHMGHTTPAGRKAHAHNLLLWSAMNALAKRGVTTLDLGLETAPALDRFKRRAGAARLPTAGTWLRWTPI